MLSGCKLLIGCLKLLVAVAQLELYLLPVGDVDQRSDKQRAAPADISDGLASDLEPEISSVFGPHPVLCLIDRCTACKMIVQCAVRVLPVIRMNEHQERLDRAVNALLGEPHRLIPSLGDPIRPAIDLQLPDISPRGFNRQTEPPFAESQHLVMLLEFLLGMR
ncbi:hypothetical protein D3C71_1714060 [compost metagenome]